MHKHKHINFGFIDLEVSSDVAFLILSSRMKITTKDKYNVEQAMLTKCIEHNLSSHSVGMPWSNTELKSHVIC